MLTEIYIEALLVDKELADQVWQAWDKGAIDGRDAALVWFVICYYSKNLHSFQWR